MTYQRIDESLAKGLADYYATAIEIEREKFERSIDKRRLFQISNRKTWYTAVDEMSKKHPNHVISSYVRQSKSHPMWFHMVPTVNTTDIEEFEEKSYSLMLMQATAEGHGMTSGVPLVQISQHVIQRLIERKPGEWLLNGRLNTSLISPAMKDIGNWCMLYTVLHIFTQTHDNKTIYPVIPTDGGVFLCHLRRAAHCMVSVRTFVGNDKLRPEQIRTANLLKSIYSKYRNLPFFTYLCFDEALTLTSGAYMGHFFGQLLENAREFAEIMLGGKDEDHNERLGLVRGLRQTYEKFPPGLLQKIDELGEPFAKSFQLMHNDFKQVTGFAFKI